MVALLPETGFGDGTIDVVGARRGGYATDNVSAFKGFVGISFRVHDDTAERFYVRPENARLDDQVFRNRSTQYEADPAFPWNRLRQEAPGAYESYVDIQPGTWTHLRIEVSGTTARLYVNAAAQPCLVVNDLKNGASRDTLLTRECENIAAIRSLPSNVSVGESMWRRPLHTSITTHDREALMRSTIFRIILGISTAFTAACSNADSITPTSVPAAPRRDVSANADGNGSGSAKQSIDRYIPVSCMNDGAGETVHVTGDLRYDMKSMQDANGVYHLNIKSNSSNLSAVGLASGTIFRGQLGERITSRAEDYLNSDLRISDIIRFVAPGSGIAYSLVITSHIVIDGGTYVVWDDTWDEVCR